MLVDWIAPYAVYPVGLGYILFLEGGNLTPLADIISVFEQCCQRISVMDLSWASAKNVDFSKVDVTMSYIIALLNHLLCHLSKRDDRKVLTSFLWKEK